MKSKVLVLVSCGIAFSGLLLTFLSCGGVKQSGPVDQDPQNHDPQAAGVLQWKADNSGRGLYSNETILTPAGVNVSQFGKLATFTTDGTIMAQPLYIANLDMGSAGTHNVLILATEHDSVFAFDADHPGAPLWTRQYLDPAAGVTSLTSGISGRITLGPEAGITGTPFVDPSSDIMYFVTVIARNRKAEQWLRAVDIRTGKDFGPGSVQINASVPGGGHGSVNGKLAFDALRENQRPGLVELNGKILIAWGSFSDFGTYHGWIMAYDAKTLQQIAVFNSTPQFQANDITAGPIAHGGGGSFWQGGASPAIDSDGNIYVVAADGSFNADQGGQNFGDSVLKLRLNGNTFQVVDWFAPSNQACINAANLDFGSGGFALLPPEVSSTHKLGVASSKEGRLYLLDLGNLGKLNPSGDTQIPQALLVGSQGCTATTGPGADDSPAWNRLYGNVSYWNGNIYAAPSNTTLKQYQFQNGVLAAAPVAASATAYGERGGNTVVSSNGKQAGIVWAYEKTPTGHAVLHAYDAASVSRELWNSDMNRARDGLTGAVPFGTPVVVNGRVIATSQNNATIYGMLR
ncbi:MAG TPA: hypothetical protein VLT16_13485 [Candidatus Limnocylindrales bacterium]|nr:hypothetical protein [Candidatus Limnocylindrales bacterium]